MLITCFPLTTKPFRCISYTFLVMCHVSLWGSVLKMRLSIFFLAVLASQSNADHVAVGDACGITGSSALDPDFVGNARVYGPGCTIGDETDCYCAPELDGVDDAAPWFWQCGDAVVFGPSVGKECPATLPLGECDATTQPTGFAGDPGCYYSDCNSAATFSSVCGCVNLTIINQGEGNEWFCLNSTCTCPHTDDSTSGAAVASILPLGLLIGLLGFVLN